ncbi:alpha/beta hydrolase [Vacuolonema iberomarrocanum]|uniref:alpha/beta hydrolase n=1 Tax=Vacuolonema iberomarrocanum TaxID=3454632 RepID=UPI001A0AB661|nr:alpha/beta hydrolase [filamentous cyanobacterium LEGE 07170]
MPAPFRKRLPLSPTQSTRFPKWMYRPGCSHLTPQRSPHRRSFWWRKLGLVAGGTLLALMGGMGSVSQAADHVTIKLGPLENSVTVDDLEHYARTGEVPDSMQMYGWVLNEQTQRALINRVPVSAAVGRQLVNDLLNSSAGDRFLQTLQEVLPGSTRDDLYAALTDAAAHSDGLTLLGFLEEFPQDGVTVDLSAVFQLASEMNLPYWQSQSLSSVLEQELTVPQVASFTTGIDPTKPGNQWVRERTLTLHDRDRHRTIPVDLYWSRHGYSGGPTVVISHGFGADRRFLKYLARHLASHGFTVAALEHPGSNVAWLASVINGQVLSDQFAEVLPATEFIDRPRDVSFLLSELNEIAQQSYYLRDKIDTNNVVVIGHSLGGYTALALAGAELNLPNLREFCNGPDQFGLSVADWLQCTAVDLPDDLPNLRDRRVTRIVALNPLIGRLFDETSLEENITIPTMFVTSTADAITPAVNQQLLPYTHLQNEERYLLTAIGATHLSVGDPENLNPALNKSLFVRERQSDETESLRLLLQGVALAFTKQETPEARRYRQFLTPGYAQSFSTTDLKLRLNGTVPPNLSNWLQMASLPLEQMTLMPDYTQPGKARTLQATYAGVVMLLLSVPLAMFILPDIRLFSALRRSLWTKPEPPPSLPLPPQNSDAPEDQESE